MNCENAISLYFTSATVCVIHLEITHDFSSRSLVFAIRRFIARRGKPALFVSDNFISLKAVDVKGFILKIKLSGNSFKGDCLSVFDHFVCARLKS